MNKGFACAREVVRIVFSRSRHRMTLFILRANRPTLSCQWGGAFHANR